MSSSCFSKEYILLHVPHHIFLSFSSVAGLEINKYQFATGLDDHHCCHALISIYHLQRPSQLSPVEKVNVQVGWEKESVNSLFLMMDFGDSLRTRCNCTSLESKYNTSSLPGLPPPEDPPVRMVMTQPVLGTNNV